MFKSTALMVAFAGFALAVPAQAAPTQGEDGASTAKAEQPKDKTVCRRQTFVGSNLPKKTCKTESEWRAEDAQAQRQFNERDRDGN